MMPCERPILFSGPMVRAILAGTKTQTRRIVKPQPQPYGRSSYGGTRQGWAWEKRKGWERSWNDDDKDPYGRVSATFAMGRECPFGVPGDRLWCKESHWRFTGCAPAPSAFVPAPDGDPYQARCYDDYPELESLRAGACLVRVPSIHMFRWASRLLLEVTHVRVQRLQEISEADAQAEGVRPFFEAYKGIGRDQRLTSGELAADSEHRASFAVLWDEINADRATWKSDPWVWAVSFSRVNP
jgi:hypothetical protein